MSEVLKNVCLTVSEKDDEDDEEEVCLFVQVKHLVFTPPLWSKKFWYLPDVQRLVSGELLQDEELVPHPAPPPPAPVGGDTS